MREREKEREQVSFPFSFFPRFFPLYFHFFFLSLLALDTPHALSLLFYGVFPDITAKEQFKQLSLL